MEFSVRTLQFWIAKSRIELDLSMAEISFVSKNKEKPNICTQLYTSRDKNVEHEIQINIEKTKLVVSEQII